MAAPEARRARAGCGVNLLPWRERLRQKRKQEFLKMLAAAPLLAVAIIAGVDRFYDSAIGRQQARNDFLDREISLLEKRIVEVRLIRQRRDELLARMKAIQELQGDRAAMVRLFDELARRVAPGVFFTSLRMADGRLWITGLAESNDGVSGQLRSLSGSVWFRRPQVTAINAAPAFGPEASRFELMVEQAAPEQLASGQAEAGQSALGHAVPEQAAPEHSEATRGSRPWR